LIVGFTGTNQVFVMFVAADDGNCSELDLTDGVGLQEVWCKYRKIAG